MLTDERRRMPFGSTVALVTAVVTRPLEISIDRLRRHGVEVAVIYVGLDDPPPTVGGAQLHDIREALAGLEFEQIGSGGAWALADHEWRPPPAPEELDGAAPEPRQVEAPPLITPLPAASSLEPGTNSEWGRPGAPR